ncbi:MAG TPA: HAMP domain-containing sensor histidine kinase [Polyangiaceae bacterium]|jgi:signal transduction histidine kinase|nr:HAMP domain-containing sensor histidine kinase [Polyangiaceae bacterium]
MSRLPCAEAGSKSPHAARFEALRERVFQEMSRSSVRWRLTWILPFHFLTVGLLIVGGESAPRAIVQALCVLGTTCIFLARSLSANRKIQAFSFIFWAISYFALCATTGGISSPYIVTLGLMTCVASMGAPRPGWTKTVMLTVLVVGFIGLALLSHTSLAQLTGPLAPTASGPSAELVVLTLMSVAVTMLGVTRMGTDVTSGYGRVALELAERREELCSENEDRTRALEGIAARLAHEVKNPLAAIKGLSTHMARNATDPKTAERLAIVAGEADRLQSIVESFLSFSRGLDDLKLGPTKPHEVARELGVLLETRAEEAGVAIEIGGDENLVLDADPRKLRQALLNIVLNAIQASPRGSHVHLMVARDCEGARLTVRDEGVGMTHEVLERIRKPYFTTKEGGTGLGLAVARGLVEQHGGRLEFKSAPRHGTTVTILLPMVAKPCMRLPNPGRAFRSGEIAAVGSEGETAVSEPVVAGVR